MSFFSGRNVAKPFMVSSVTMNVFLITQPVHFTSNGNQYYHEWILICTKIPMLIIFPTMFFVYFAIHGYLIITFHGFEHKPLMFLIEQF